MRTRLIFATLTLLLPFVACAPEEKKAGLVIAVQTDMSVPKDVDAVEIEVSTYGNVMFANKYEVGEGGLSIPATLTLLPPEDSSTPVTIRVISFQGNKTRTLRRVVTTVPDSREALLRMPIQWLCDGEVEETQGKFTSSCKTGSSCLAGSCTSDEVDVRDLPSFALGAVFGRNTDGDKTCFQTVNCMAAHTVIDASRIDLESCTASLAELEQPTAEPVGTGGASGDVGSGGRGPDAAPAGGSTGGPGPTPGSGGGTTGSGSPAGGATSSAGGASFDDGKTLSTWPRRGALAELGPIEPGKLNFALSMPPGGDGICGEGDEAAFGCYIPLDFDETAGWRLEGDTVHLPQAVCRKLSEPNTTFSLVASTSCPSKSAEIPTCGPWYQGNGSSITVDLPNAPSGSGGAGQSSGGTSNGGDASGGASTSAGGAFVSVGGVPNGGIGGDANGGFGGSGPDYEGGYFTSATWHGYPWVAFSPASYVSPEDFSHLPAGSDLCVHGSVGIAVDDFVLLGVNLNQSTAGEMPPPGVIPTRDGIDVVLSSNYFPSTPLRLQIQSATGLTWCAPLSSSGGFVPYSTFNTACWNGSGDEYPLDMPITDAGIVIPSGGSAVDFDFCLSVLEEMDYVP